MGECLIIRSGGGTDTSGATATAARVLSGYTCYVNDVKITGTMANQGTKNASLNAGGSYTVPAGYHSGSGKVTANALSGQTSATATAARILSGRTAWVNGSKLTGTMTNRGAISQKLAANGSYTVPAGWHNGSGKVTQSLTTQGAKNVTPKTTNQTACAASRWTTGNIVIVGSSTLIAGNIKKGVKIFNVTGTFTGWVDSTAVIYQSGSASTLVPWITYTDSGMSVSVTSSWIQLYSASNSRNHDAAIVFDLNNFINKTAWMYITFSVVSNYGGSGNIVSVWQAYSTNFSDIMISSGFNRTSHTASSTVSNDYVVGTYTRCDKVVLNDKSLRCIGPSMRNLKTGNTFSVRLTKIWLQFV